MAAVVELDDAAACLYEARGHAALPRPRRRTRAEEMERAWEEAQALYRSRFDAALAAYEPTAEEICEAIRRQAEEDLRRAHARDRAAESERKRVEALVNARLDALAEELRWGVSTSNAPGDTLHVVCEGVPPRAVPGDATRLTTDTDVRALRELLAARGWAGVVFDDSIEEHVLARFADLPGMASRTGLWQFWWRLFKEDYKTGTVPRPSPKSYGSSHTSYTGFHF